MSELLAFFRQQHPQRNPANFAESQSDTTPFDGDTLKLMWVLLRLAIAAAAFFIRYSRIHWGRPDGTLNGVPFYRSQSRTRSGTPTSYRVRIPVDQGFLFSFHYESSTDRFFKSLGLANEVQTGDSRFDSKIYVTCDHTGLRELLRSHEGIRTAVLKILEGKADPKLRCDGRFLSIEGQGAPSHSVQQVAQELLHFQGTLSQASQEIRWAPFWKDAFFYKALFVESLIWAIAAYGLTALFASLSGLENRVASYGRLISLSLTGGLIATGAGLFLLQLWFRGSSRGHRILVESAVMLAFGLPLSAYQATEDLNRELDTSPGVEETRTILDTRERRHRRRRGRTYYSYHLYLGADTTGHSLIPEPRWIQVPQSMYSQVRSQQIKEIHLVMGRGWLGVPWFKSMTF